MRDKKETYSLFAIMLHWLMAVAIIGLFALGLWMVTLDYYHPWYKTGPDIHRAIGVLLFITLIIRLAYRFISPPPEPVRSIKLYEHILAVFVHWALYILIAVTAVTGYLISTADGRAVDVFGWFQIPATVTSIEDQEDFAGMLHYYLAFSIVILAGLHALAALKHHFFDRDETLLRMLGRRKKQSFK